ncbi:hypothetical protein DOY81_003568 [Sarcophaga bullata]|nr:hypothetical protein DOY81_003568 [Sarcophaga bullata]
MPVKIPVLAIHHDPEFYPQPDEFQPERFAPDIAKQRDPVVFLPFGDGPRNCIGERFGRLQSLLGLAYLVKHFRFSTCPKTQIPMTRDPKSLAYVPKNVTYLYVEAVN